MLELLEQLTPPAEKLLEDPSVATAGLTAGSIAFYTFVIAGGQLKAEYEIRGREQEYIAEKHKEIEEKIHSSTSTEDIYLKLRHPWLNGKLSTYENFDQSSECSEINENQEYFNQIYSDKKLEELD